MYIAEDLNLACCIETNKTDHPAREIRATALLYNVINDQGLRVGVFLTELRDLWNWVKRIR